MVRFMFYSFLLKEIMVPFVLSVYFGEQKLIFAFIYSTIQVLKRKAYNAQ
jgi:hypothetical protein